MLNNKRVRAHQRECLRQVKTFRNMIKLFNERRVGLTRTIARYYQVYVIINEGDGSYRAEGCNIDVTARSNNMFDAVQLLREKIIGKIKYYIKRPEDRLPSYVYKSSNEDIVYSGYIGQLDMDMIYAKDASTNAKDTNTNAKDTNTNAKNTVSSNVSVEFAIRGRTDIDIISDSI